MPSWLGREKVRNTRKRGKKKVSQAKSRRRKNMVIFESPLAIASSRTRLRCDSTVDPLSTFRARSRPVEGEDRPGVQLTMSVPQVYSVLRSCTPYSGLEISGIVVMPSLRPTFL